MAAGHLCDFCEILACWRWVWCGVLLEFAKNNCLAGNTKRKGARAKNSM